METVRYADGALDAETGFYYLRARYYDPDTGIFIGTDPLDTTIRSIAPAIAYADYKAVDASDPRLHETG